MGKEGIMLIMVLAFRAIPRSAKSCPGAIKTNNNNNKKEKTAIAITYLLSN